MDKIMLWEMLDFGNDAFCGGLFLATQNEVQDLINKKICFGDIEGKYSDVAVTFDSMDDFRVISSDENVIKEFKKLFGESYGYNPVEIFNNNC